MRDNSDIIGTTDQSQFFPDVGVGIFAYRLLEGGFNDKFIYGGVSVPQVLGLDLTFQNENGEFFTERIQHIYGLLGAYFFFDNDSFIEPSVWLKYVPNAPINVDVNLRYQLPANFWVGAGGSSGGTAHLEAGFVLGDIGSDSFLRIGYGFDYSFSSFGPTAGTTCC